MATHSSILAWRIPMDRGAWWAAVHGGHKESDATKHSTAKHKNCIHGFAGSSAVTNLPSVREMQVQSLGQKDPPEEKMVTYCSILAWRIPWTEEPGGLHFIGLQKSHTRLND